MYLALARIDTRVSLIPDTQTSDLSGGYGHGPMTVVRSTTVTHKAQKSTLPVDFSGIGSVTVFSISRARVNKR